MIALLDKICLGLNRGVEYLLFGLGFTMAMLVAVQVFARYVLNHSLFWSEELARYLLVWLTFLGATVAYHRGVHPGVDVVTSRLPAGAARICRVLVILVSMGLFGVMVVSGCRFAWFVRMQITPSLSLPKWIILAIIPVSGALLLLHGLAFLLHTIFPPQDTQTSR